MTRIAVGLAVLGFGAKAGLVPLHAWLPDAHSQAPAPISALMSGVLLSVALYAVLRVKLVADAALGPAYLRTLLLILALATLAVAAVLLLTQRRLQADAGLLQHGAHGADGPRGGGGHQGWRSPRCCCTSPGTGWPRPSRSSAAGHLLHQEGTSQIAQVRATGRAGRRCSAGVFGLATLALLGLPPSALFASELGLARALAADGLGWVLVVAFGLVLVAFAAIGTRTAGMLLGGPAAPVVPVDAEAPALVGAGVTAAPAGGAGSTVPAPRPRASESPSPARPARWTSPAPPPSHW